MARGDWAVIRPVASAWAKPTATVTSRLMTKTVSSRTGRPRGKQLPSQINHCGGALGEMIACPADCDSEVVIQPSNASSR